VVGRVRPGEPLDGLGTRPTRLAGDRLALPDSWDVPQNRVATGCAATPPYRVWEVSLVVGRVRPGEPLDGLGTRPTRLAGDRLALPDSWDVPQNRVACRMHALENCSRDVALRQFYGSAESMPSGHVRRNRCRVRAARAMRAHTSDKRRFQQQFSWTVIENVHGFPAPAQVPAFHQNRAAESFPNPACRLPHVFRQFDLHAGQDLRLVEIGSDQGGERQQLRLQHGHSGVLQEPFATGRDHHGIDDQRRPLLAREEVRDDPNDLRAEKHAGFHCSRWQFREDRFDLPANNRGGARLNGDNPFGVLRRDRGDRARAMHAQRCKRLQVRLNPCPAAAVGTGDGEGDALSCLSWGHEGSFANCLKIASANFEL